MTDSDISLPNAEQRRWVFICIAQDALMARRLCLDAMQEIAATSESGDAQLAGVKALLEKIGMLADLHAGDVVPEIVGDWMLPPAYHKAAEDRSEQP